MHPFHYSHLFSKKKHARLSKKTEGPSTPHDLASCKLQGTSRAPLASLSFASQAWSTSVEKMMQPKWKSLAQIWSPWKLKALKMMVIICYHGNCPCKCVPAWIWAVCVCVRLSLDFMCEISLPMTSSTGHPCFPIVYECMKESRRRQFPGMQLGFQMKGQLSVWDPRNLTCQDPWDDSQPHTLPRSHSTGWAPSVPTPGLGKCWAMKCAAGWPALRCLEWQPGASSRITNSIACGN